MEQKRFHVGISIVSAALLVFGAFVSAEGPSDSGFVIPITVGGLLAFAGGILGFVGLLRFPYRVTLTPEALELRYLHRRLVIPRDAIRGLEIRGTFVSRNVWLIRSDGREEPLGIRSPAVTRAWNEISDGNPA